MGSLMYVLLMCIKDTGRGFRRGSKHACDNLRPKIFNKLFSTPLQATSTREMTPDNITHGRQRAAHNGIFERVKRLAKRTSYAVCERIRNKNPTFVLSK